MRHEHFAVPRLRSEIYKIKIAPKIPFQLNRKIKIRLKRISATKTDFLCFVFLELIKLGILFQKQIFYIWMKGEKTDLAISNNPNGESHGKKLFWNKGKYVWNREILHKDMPICTRENSCHPAKVFFLTKLYSHCW